MKKLKNRSQSRTISQKTARFLLRLLGWQARGDVPREKKYIMIGYPHTSNWDLPIGLLIFTALGVRLHWIGKHTLFKKPFGWFMRRLGGIPVNRSAPEGFVKQIAAQFDNYDELIIGISPEGTRRKTSYWKTGFYRIASEAHIPIALGFVDFPSKSGGFGPLIQPSGDLESDLIKISDFYKSAVGKNPGKSGDIQLRG